MTKYDIDMLRWIITAREDGRRSLHSEELERSVYISFLMW
jgi:hypothetical protein